MLQTYLLDTVPGLVPEDIKQKYPNDKTGQINTLLGKNPLLFDTYLSEAVEVDVDCLCDGEQRLRLGHHGAYRGGRHPFGRLACSLPVRSLSADDRRRARAPDGGARQARSMSAA
jgi:carbamoyl-phosphate synthase large subunit